MSADSVPVLVLGMHRSGTSYLASRLQAFGVNLGDDLVGALPGNPRGHFEDKGILAFHEQLIAARRGPGGRAFDRDMMVTETLDRTWTAAERDEAQALLEGRRQAGLWGWKEPRTALFLQNWRKLLPDLKGVVIYRHPLAVHFSALRRRHWDLVLFPDQVFRAYANYNRALLDAVAAEPERYLVLSAEAAFGEMERLDALLSEFLPLSAPRERPVFHAGEFATRPVPAAATALLEQLVPEAMAAYADLNECARLPAPSPAEGAGAEQLARRFPWFEELAEWLPERRRLLVPLLETLWFEEAPSPSELRRDLAEEIGQKVRETEAWNERAQQIFEDNKRIDEERTRLGEAFAEQQAFLDRHTKDFEKVWADHQKLGRTWVRQNEHIAAQAKRIEELEARLRQLGAEPVESPPQS